MSFTVTVLAIGLGVFLADLLYFTFRETLAYIILRKTAAQRKDVQDKLNLLLTGYGSGGFGGGGGTNPLLNPLPGEKVN